MNDIFVREVLESLIDVFYDGNGLIFCKKPILSYFTLKIPLVTEFGNDVAVAIAGKDFKTSKDIGVI